jgi:hypothetical protein
MVDFRKDQKAFPLLFVSILALFFLVIISRRTDAITNPQFWAEDSIWFSQVYNATNPLAPLLVSTAGYFQSIGKIGAILCLPFDLKTAPLLFNLMAIGLQILPAGLFLARRFEPIVPNMFHRALLGFAYLALPATGEINANLTNSQWHLALLMFLIIIAPPGKTVWWRIFDGFFLLLAGVSGPFVFFALPVLLIFNWFKPPQESRSSRRGEAQTKTGESCQSHPASTATVQGFNARTFASRNFSPDRLLKLVIIGTTFLVQLVAPFFGEGRVKGLHGADFDSVLKVVSGKVFLIGIFGFKSYEDVMFTDLWQSGLVPLFLGVVGISLLTYVFWHAKIELRLFLTYCFLIFAAAMRSPMISLHNPDWKAMLISENATRYYFFAMLA